MRWLWGAAIGLVVGLVAGYGAGMVWNPDSYEKILPLMLGGMVFGAVAGAVLVVKGGRKKR